MGIKKKAKKKIHCYEALIRRFKVTPTSMIYMDMLHVLQVLHMQGEHELVIALCDAAITNIQE